MRFPTLLVLAPFLAYAASGKPPSFVGSIERIDPAFDRLVAPGANIEKLADGFLWAEGPVWIDGAVVFSDVLANTAYRWKPEMTMPEVFLKPSGLLARAPGFKAPGSNGLGRDREGRLLLCQQGERRVVRYGR